MKRRKGYLRTAITPTLRSVHSCGGPDIVLERIPQHDKLQAPQYKRCNLFLLQVKVSRIRYNTKLASVDQW